MFHLIEYNSKLSILFRRTYSLLFKFYSNSLYSRFVRNVSILDNNVFCNTLFSALVTSLCYFMIIHKNQNAVVVSL